MDPQNPRTDKFEKLNFYFISSSDVENTTKARKYSSKVTNFAKDIFFSNPNDSNEVIKQKLSQSDIVIVVHSFFYTLKGEEAVAGKNFAKSGHVYKEIEMALTKQKPCAILYLVDDDDVPTLGKYNMPMILFRNIKNIRYKFKCYTETRSKMQNSYITIVHVSDYFKDPKKFVKYSMNKKYNQEDERHFTIFKSEFNYNA